MKRRQVATAGVNEDPCRCDGMKLPGMWYIYAKTMILDICLSPALYPSYMKEDDVVVVVDIFRASTTMCVAF